MKARWYIMVFALLQVPQLKSDSSLHETIEQTGASQGAQLRDIQDANLIIESIVKLMTGALLSAKQHSFAQGGLLMLDGIENFVRIIAQEKTVTAEQINQLKQLLQTIDATTHQEFFAAIWQDVIQEVAAVDQLDTINQIDSELEIVV